MNQTLLLHMGIYIYVITVIATVFRSVIMIVSTPIFLGIDHVI